MTNHKFVDVLANFLFFEKFLKTSGKDFPFFNENPNLVYFDNAATTQKPQSVLDVMIKYYSTYNANVHRGVYKIAEKETYALPIIDDIQIIDISEMEDWELHYEEIAYDTTFDTTYTSIDSTSEFLRHSIRPKFKIKLFDENIVFDYRFYFKPKVEDFNDYLLEHELKISIATFYELLTVNLNYSHKYNSRFDSEDILNPDTYEFYKPVDESISIGLSFMF